RGRAVGAGRGGGARRRGRPRGRGRRRGCRPSAPAGVRRRLAVAPGGAGVAGRGFQPLAGPTKVPLRRELTRWLSLACGNGPRRISARPVKVATGTFFPTTFLNRSHRDT